MKLLLPFLLCPAFCLSQVVHLNPNFPDQYKKQNRDAIALIVDGKIEAAIGHFEAFLSKHQDDLESYYGLAIAYAQQDNLDRAMEYVKLAVSAGLPPERFMAGPRRLLAPLNQHAAFQTYMTGRYNSLIHGPMLGNFTDERASVWLRTDAQKSLTLSVSGRPPVHAQSDPARDYTAVFSVEHLVPNTSYEYFLSTSGEGVLEAGVFTTFPEAGKAASFRLGFGGGAGYTPFYERMWDTLLTHPMTAFFLLGDNVYIDLPEYPDLQDYCYYRRQSRPEFRRFAAAVPIYSIWDDHDFGDNDCYGGTAVDQPAWKIPVWEKFQLQWINPYYGGGRENPGCYYDFSIADVDFFMLDTRYYRTNGKDAVKPDTMLGAVQTQWLYDKLLASSGTFKVICTSVPISTGTKTGRNGQDTWDGFAEEREALFSFIEKHKIEGVFFLAADRHRSDAWKTDRKKGYPMYEFMSSRLTNIHTHPVMANSLFGYNKTPSFGLIEFDTQAADPKVKYRIFSIENEEIHQMTLYKSQLTTPEK